MEATDTFLLSKGLKRVEKMSNYSIFSYYYDALTKNVNYKERVGYILDILNRHSITPETILDLACGTGSVMIELLKKGYDVFGIDASPDMLVQAKDKCIEAGFEDSLLVCQKMQELEIPEKVDTILCCLDSINHLNSKKTLSETLNRVFSCLNNNGAFIFDINTLYKHKHILAYNAFVYETEDVFCVWQNEYTHLGKVKINLDFFEYQGKLYDRYSESFYEQTYEIDEYVEMLKEAGFREVYCYDDCKLTDPHEKSERVYFIAIK